VKPDKKLSIKDMFALYRDHYEGTKYDLTTGISAGPFGNPERWAGVEQPKTMQQVRDGKSAEELALSVVKDHHEADVTAPTKQFPYG